MTSTIMNKEAVPQQAIGAVDEVIHNIVRKQAREEFDMIERDLLTIPGVHEEMTQAQAQALDLQIIYQIPPGGQRRRYRGIAQAGALLVDRHPEWGDEGVVA